MVLFTGALIRDKHSESRNLKEANNQSDRLLLICAYLPAYLPVRLPYLLTILQSTLNKIVNDFKLN